ncbi:hypothetical protein MLD38_016814 [Melastoma candidum]|uniref:Uncharacterized protein n=1 Tax=Melastoma candidum TaxID=119954 RepID=A0ACB9QMZ1_9MYRT|nr:hypothetical protein MLD38_016814 [Melastoma candidum]
MLNFSEIYNMSTVQEANSREISRIKVLHADMIYAESSSIYSSSYSFQASAVLMRTQRLLWRNVRLALISWSTSESGNAPANLLPNIMGSWRDPTLLHGDPRGHWDRKRDDGDRDGVRSQFLVYWMVPFVFILCVTYFGMMITFLAPVPTLAAFAVSFLTLFWASASGVVVVLSDIRFYKWMCCSNPFQHALSLMTSIRFSRDSSKGSCSQTLAFLFFAALKHNSPPQV